MFNLKKNLRTALFTAGACLVAASSFAQMPPHDGPGPGPEQFAKFEKMRARHLAQFHDKLKLAATQETAWTDYVAKTTPPHPEGPPPHPQGDNAGKDGKHERPTTLQILAHQEEFMKKHDAEMVQVIAATKAFYAVLTPEQQSLFDEEQRKMERHRFQPGRDGHGGPHGEHGGPDGGPHGHPHGDDE